MTMIDIIKEDLLRMIVLAGCGDCHSVLEAAEQTLNKIEYYGKGVDEALCAMEKTWNARDRPVMDVCATDNNND